MPEKYVRDILFPKPKDCNLNVLEPGSYEAVTRPMHVHEHLLPMYPEKEQDTPVVAYTIEISTSPEISGTYGTDKPKDPFTRPYDFTTNLQDVKRPRLRFDDEGRTREISSVMMTMSGLLIPAREGKLPEAWPPMVMSEEHEKYICNSHHSSASKVPTLEERSDKQSKENKTFNCKVMKSKNKDKRHKSDGSKHKPSKLSKAVANTSGHWIKSKEGHNLYNQLSMPLPKASTTQKTSMPPPPAPLDIARPAIPQPLCAPIFPKPKDCNLNFLKPGSHEAVARPMHVHEQMPPIYPEKEQDTPLVANTIEICTSPEISGTDGTDKPKDPFTRPYDFTTNLQDVKRPRLRFDDEGRTREISSVMMTMSGLLIPAREGKLPEAWPPMVMSEEHEKYICNSHHSSASKVPTLEERSDKKSKKNKTLDGKVMKSKNNDKSKKSDGSKHKPSKLSKAVANTSGHLIKSKEGHNLYNQLSMPLPKASTTQKTSMLPPSAPLNIARPAITQPLCAPTFPKPKDCNLNFLKPGSHEAVARPMHVHEQMPPMYPEKEQDTPLVANTIEICTSPEISGTDGTDKPKDPFTRPYDFTTNLQDVKRPRLRFDDEGRTREISGVMMTMPGLLIPAREGKLPEPWPPMVMSEKHEKYICNSHHPSASKVPTLEERSDKKSKESKTLDGKVMNTKNKDKSQKNYSSKHKDSKLSKAKYLANTSGHLIKSKEGHNLYNQLPKASTTQKTIMPPPPASLDIARPAIPQPLCAPIFPKPKDCNLNFLKPVSHEAVTRPMLVHEHLPPMYPEKEQDTPLVANTIEICTSPEISDTDGTDKPKDPFKIHYDFTTNLQDVKRPRLRSDDEERTRKKRSVMMTMSGLLLPAREGKLPEARKPIFMSEKHDKYICHSHNSNALKVPALEQRSDKKSKGNKTLYGKVMKTKNKDKIQKNDSSKHKDSKLSKAVANTPGHLSKSKEGHNLCEKSPMPLPKVSTTQKTSMLLPPAPLDTVRPAIKKEPLDIQQPRTSTTTSKNLLPTESEISVPRKNPVSKSSLLPNPVPRNKHQPATVTHMPEIKIKKKVIDEEEKLNSQPDRYKQSILNKIYKKQITHKSKDDKYSTDAFSDKPQSTVRITNVKDHTIDNIPAHDQRNINNDSVETFKNKTNLPPNVSANKLLQLPYPKDGPGLILAEHILSAMKMPPLLRWPSLEVIPVPNPTPLLKPVAPPGPTKDDIPQETEITIKKNYKSIEKDKEDKDGIKIKKKKDKKDQNKDKSEEKRIKEERQELKQKIKKEQKEDNKKKLAEGLVPKLTLKLGSSNSNSPMPPSSPDVFKQNLKPAVKNEDESPSIKEETVTREHSRSPELAQISALVTRPPKQKHSSKHTHVSEQEAQTSSLPSGSSLLKKNRPHSSQSKYKRTPLSKNDHFDEETASRSKEPTPPPPSDSVDKPLPLSCSANLLPSPFALTASGHGLTLVQNILSSMKMPPLIRRLSLEVIPVENDLEATHKTINREKDHSHKGKSPTIPKIPPLLRRPSLEVVLEPTPQSKPVAHPAPTKPPAYIKNETDVNVKKKNKSHKKDKKDKDGNKIKKNKDKKDKNNDKSEKKQKKEERQELKQNINKERNEKKKQELAEGLVPKLILKLGSSNSNSQVLPSSSDVFKLNIKPVVKKTEDESPSMKVDTVSHERCHSPELAQIPDLVTIPPKQKHSSKHTHVSEQEAPTSSLPSSSSLSEKNRLPSSQFKYKMTPLSRNCHFDEETASRSKEPTLPPPSDSVDKPLPPLPTPYNVDEYGIKIWVCPACSRRDDGSPMIGCDGCDSWYHWVCVGISEEPGLAEDWFCKSCAKRTAMAFAEVSSGKKRVRKPKTKVQRL